MEIYKLGNNCTNIQLESIPYYGNFIHELKALNFQNHKVSIIGNHSWASAAMKTMVAHFENDFKDIEIVSEPLDIKSSLKEEDIPLIEKMADDIKASIDAQEIKEVL